ncbi:CpsB/CapC family capsule biosynthesis tyrosine phosphatase [Patulibacter sp. SYSU D01012]|uniref:tyrosine-protein phosphatase n=1 Tax=Patulibacter sp. SYSU D01012 TaxID=2817381 RepID=UPI001B30BC07
MIDLHCHILPGVDDGPDDLEGSLAMAREHVARGVRTVVATPHVSWDYRTTADEIAHAVDALGDALREEGIPLTVLPGAEVALTRAVDLTREELAALTLAGGRWLLLEAPIAVDAPGLEGMIGMVQGRGVRVLLAHPERCAGFHGDPELLGRLVRGGCLGQVTASALTGAFGRTVEAAARRYVELGWVHVASSDSHDAVGRAPGLDGPVVAAGYEALAGWLTDAVPTALLAGDPPPERPAFTARRAKRRFGFRR